MSTPSLSVVMPTFNQASRLALTLSSLTRQDPPPAEWELIVVDDGSQDQTQAVVEGYLERLPIRVVQQDQAGRAAARNAGAGRAVGRTLVFCDGDRICGPSFLAAHSRFPANAALINLGEIREVYIADFDDRVQELLMDVLAGCPWLAQRARRPHFVAELYRHLIGPEGSRDPSLAWLGFLSGNVSMPRSVFELVGGFDEDFVDWGFEHFELGYRLVNVGAVVRHVPDAVNFHVAHRREPGLYEAGIESSAALLRRKHPRMPVAGLVALSRGELSLEAFLANASAGLPQ
jgi:glycosyltransferase involved in cell wall biosynthesis